jgi:hypothetical protein
MEGRRQAAHFQVSVAAQANQISFLSEATGGAIASDWPGGVHGWKVGSAEHGAWPQDARIVAGDHLRACLAQRAQTIG